MNFTIGEKIRILLVRRHMTVSELAAATGQTRQNLTNKLSRDNFTAKETEAMAKALGCTVETIFTMDDTGEAL